MGVHTLETVRSGVPHQWGSTGNPGQWGVDEFTLLYIQPPRIHHIRIGHHEHLLQ
jgi:hypothetical protein